MTINSLFDVLDENNWIGGVFISYANTQNNHNIYEIKYFDYIPNIKNNEKHYYQEIKNKKIINYNLLVDELELYTSYFFIEIDMFNNANIVPYLAAYDTLEQVLNNTQKYKYKTITFKIKNNNQISTIFFPLNNLVIKKIDTIKNCKIGNSNSNINITGNIIIDVIDKR